MTVPHTASAALGTLALTTAQIIAGPVMTRGGTAMSVRGSISIHGLTAGDGPWQFGIMNTDITGTLLEEFLELGGPLTPNDTSGVERQSRGKKIRTLGVIAPVGNGTVAVLYLDNESLKGLRFSESGESAGWTYYLYNLGQAMTTGATWLNAVQFFVKFNPSG